MEDVTVLKQEEVIVGVYEKVVGKERKREYPQV